MSKTIKKILAALLAVSAIECTFVGCSSKKNDNEKETASSSKVPEVYFEGFMGWIGGDGKQKSSDEVYKEVQNYITENSGVKPVPVLLPRGSEKEKLNILISSNDERLDVFMTGNWDEYAKKGLIMPLNDLIEKSGSDIKKAWSKYDFMWKQVTDDKGKIWALPRSLSTTSYPTWVRKDWLDKCGLKAPQTLDELENVLKTFKEKDPAGNGQTIPLITELNGIRYAFSSGFTKEGYGNWVDKDGKVKPGELQPGFKEAIAKMADWYKKGYIYKESFIIKREQQNELVTSNRIGSSIMWYSLIANNAEILEKNVPGANYEFCNGIKGPQGFLETRTQPGASGLMILKKAKNPEAAMKLMNWVIKDTNNFVSQLYGIPEKDWTYAKKDEHWVKTTNTRYGGEFYIYPNNYSLQQFGIVDPNSGKLSRAYQFMMKDQYRYEKTKSPLDFGVRYPNDILNDIAPNRTDISRMMDEELVKFVTGVRPMSEWDQFIKDLYKAGLDKVIEANTKIYNASKKN